MYCLLLQPAYPGDPKSFLTRSAPPMPSLDLISKCTLTSGSDLSSFSSRARPSSLLAPVRRSSRFPYHSRRDIFADYPKAKMPRRTAAAAAAGTYHWTREVGQTHWIERDFRIYKPFVKSYDFFMGTRVQQNKSAHFWPLSCERNSNGSHIFARLATGTRFYCSWRNRLEYSILYIWKWRSSCRDLSHLTSLDCWSARFVEGTLCYSSHQLISYRNLIIAHEIKIVMKWSRNHPS